MSSRRPHSKWLTVVFAALLVVLAACTTEATATDADYYAEIVVHVEPRDDEPLGRIEPDAGTTVVRWWYTADPARWRWEFEATGPRLDAGTHLIVFDGEAAWSYDDRSRTYSRQEAMALPEGMVPSPSFNAPVGPAHAVDVDAFVDQWRARSRDGEVRRAGAGTVLGWAVEIVEIRPAWRSRSGGATAPDVGAPSGPPDAARTATSGGVVRVAIDPERMFVMRWEVDGEGGGQSYRAEVVALEYGVSIDAERFVFDPPPDASEVPGAEGWCSSAGSAVGGPGVTVPAGFLAPAYVPAGFRSVASGSESGAGCTTTAIWVLLEGDGGGSLSIQQRVRRELPDSLRAWEAVALGDRRGYREARDGIERLAWQQGELAVLLSSDVLSVEELLRVARSMA